VYLTGVRPAGPDEYGDVTVVVEFNPLGEQESEHPFLYPIYQLTADTSGNVYALSGAYEELPYLYRFAAFGEMFDGGAVLLDAGEFIDRYVATSDGLLAVGSAGDSPLLLRLDEAGEVLEREVLGEVHWANSRFSALQQAADGTIFVAGSDGEAFVDTWP
jgi:hypothetical protein